MSRDDDRDAGLEPEPAEASAAERAQAESLGKLVDRLLQGDGLPPAMDASDRLLVEASTMIVASSRELELAPDRARAVIDEAIERSVLGAARPRPRSASDLDSRPPGDVIPIAPRRRSALGRALPWSVATAAVAAAVLLFVTRPAPTRAPAPAAAAHVDETLLSRPADPLVHRIPRAEAAAAGDRLDVIHADRMAGYRQRMFRERVGGTP